MRRILVTGASGFIGRLLVRRLRADGLDEAIAPSRDELDVLAPSLRSSLDRLGHVDVVVHCAASRERAEPGAHRFVDEIAINVDAAARIFDWARAVGARAIVYVSTLSALRPLDDTGRLLDEGSPTVSAPTHPYGLTKRWGEELTVSLRGAFDAAAIVRPGMAYGREQSASSGMGRIVAAVASGAPYELAGSSGHLFAPVYIDDVVDVLARIIQAPSNILVNVGGPDAIFEREMVRDIAATLGVAIELQARAGDAPLGFAPSTARIDRAFEGRIKTPWAAGVRRAFGA